MNEENDMIMEKLHKQLSKLGTVEVLKKGKVFTLLMTSEGFSNWTKVDAINMLAVSSVGMEYPAIEVLKNEDNYLLLILHKL
jgi:hypothetical protein